MITQLTTPIPLDTPKGKAWAVAVIDYGPQWDLQWVTFIQNTGECWTFRNSQIRQQENYTFGLPAPTSIEKSKVNGHAEPDKHECEYPLDASNSNHYDLEEIAPH